VWTLRFEADPNGTNLRLPRQADRLTLRTILLTGLEGRVHFGQAAACAESTPEGATLCFADGSSTHASLVVGANGAHSVLREQLLPDCAPVDTGHLAIYGRALVPTPLANSGVLAVGLPTICQPQFVKFLPQLYDRLTMHPARIVADTIT
jgi:2-polyprenyl-6-methoxyphenol hydroxylase-like FAD-dependent oxidoreductase